MNNEYWSATIAEAQDRLMRGIAENIDDVIEQLVDEGIINEGQEADDVRGYLDGAR